MQWNFYREKVSTFTRRISDFETERDEKRNAPKRSDTYR